MSLEPKLREAALTVLRRHGYAEDELMVEVNKPAAPPYCEFRAHRLKVHVDERSATFEARGSKWSGLREDYPSAGAFVSALETELNRALSA